MRRARMGTKAVSPVAAFIVMVCMALALAAMLHNARITLIPPETPLITPVAIDAQIDYGWRIDVVAANGHLVVDEVDYYVDVPKYYIFFDID